ncbi:MAG: VOC family protein [Chloroflexota bacterium]|nr:VOC family protein [Chloroflexota bacterium]
MRQKITPFLWFNDNAEEAANFYVSVFPNSKLIDVARMGEGGPALTVAFTLDGQDFVGLNGGPVHSFTEAVSFVIDCETQEEVDRYWKTLTADGGQPGDCGWLKDRFGLSWQVVPRRLPELLTDPDPARAQRAMQAMMQMHKIDIAALEAAANG